MLRAMLAATIILIVFLIGVISGYNLAMTQYLTDQEDIIFPVDGPSFPSASTYSS